MTENHSQLVDSAKPKIRWHWGASQWWWTGFPGATGSIRVYRLRICADCGKQYPIASSGRRCQPCRRTRMKKLQSISANAHRRVADAKRRGLLANMSKTFVKCTDCDNRAEQYDHRSYAKPLEVEPVCNGCNKKRGPAIEIRALGTNHVR